MSCVLILLVLAMSICRRSLKHEQSLYLRNPGTYGRRCKLLGPKECYSDHAPLRVLQGDKHLELVTRKSGSHGDAATSALTEARSIGVRRYACSWQ